MLAQQALIAARLLLGGDDRGPPLVDHERHIQRAQDFLRGIGVDHGEGRAVGDAARTEANQSR